MTVEPAVEVLRSPPGVKAVYVFASLWLSGAAALALFVAASGASVLGEAALYALPPVAVAVAVGGTVRAFQMRLEIDYAEERVRIVNWVRAVVIPFGSIGGLSTSRLYLQTGIPAGEARAIAVVRRDGSKVRVGASKEDPPGGPLHKSMERLGHRLGVPTSLA